MKSSVYFRTPNSGFTILEMLVTISIISLLIVAGATAYINTQKTARTGRIISDLKSWQNALEAYAANTNNTYPSPDCDPGPEYLPAGIPSDPISHSVYTPVSCTDDAYCICTQLEGEETNTASNADSSCDYTAATKTSFCVSNLQ